MFKSKITKTTAELHNRLGKIRISKAEGSIEIDLNGYKLIKIPESCRVRVPKVFLK